MNHPQRTWFHQSLAYTAPSTSMRRMHASTALSKPRTREAKPSKTSADKTCPKADEGQDQQRSNERETETILSTFGAPCLQTRPKARQAQ